MLGSRPGSCHGADLRRGRRSDPGPPAAQREDRSRLAACSPDWRWLCVLAFQPAVLAGVGLDPLLQWGRLL